MTPTAKGADIVDRIAGALPAEIRADYYREMNYCRSLQENDEMLRILRSMQFLALLMYQVPERVIAERQRIEQLFGDATANLRAAIESAAAYQNSMEHRLAGLPAEVAEGIRPEIVAHEINESLRQQFVQSTLPQTAQSLAGVAAQLKLTVAEFRRAADALGNAHRGAAEDARQAIANLESTVSRAASTARNAAAELSAVFQREFRWSLYALSSLALAIGIALGLLYQRWLDAPPDVSTQKQRVVEQPAPKAKAKTAH